MTSKPDCEECLQLAVQEVEEAYLREDNKKQFLDFYHGWREQRLFPSWFLGEVKCCKCHDKIDGEKLTFVGIKPRAVSYYFHPECFDTRVIENYIKKNNVMGGGD